MNTDRRFLRFRSLAALSFFAAFCLSANANITINPTFGSSITNDPNAATIEAGIDQAISRFESSIENPISVSIDFQEMSSGLGASSTFLNQIPYSQYRSDLANNQILSANDMTALASLPMTSTNRFSKCRSLCQERVVSQHGSWRSNRITIEIEQRSDRALPISRECVELAPVAVTGEL